MTRNHPPPHASTHTMSCDGARIVESSFCAAWWLGSPHLQTLWPNVFGRRSTPRLKRERVELADGDFLDLDWTLGRSGPRVLLLHGLEGSSASPYARGMLEALDQRGFRGAVMHFRGCSGTDNRLERTYHSGETGDLDAIVSLLIAREPDAPLALIGYSLGGNVLLKWLGEKGENANAVAAAAISVPFILNEAACRLERGFSRLYQAWLLNSLRRKIRCKFQTRPGPIDLGALSTWRTFRQFDHHVTAPLHGFESVDDYYARASSRQYLPAIRVPTLIIQSRDDPFMTHAILPKAHELSDTTTLELSTSGGHVGFVTGKVPLKPNYWLESRIPDFLSAHT